MAEEQKFRYGGYGEDYLDREELETMLKETGIGIALVSPHPDGIKLIYTNDSFFDIFGYTREEYEGLDERIRLNLFNYSDFMKVIARVNTEYLPGEVQKFECRVNKKGGEEGWALFVTRRPHNAKPGDQRFVCNIVDITEIKMLQMQIQAEKERYELVEEISDDILFTYDVEADVFECSPKILRSLRKFTKVDNAVERITYGDVFDHRDIPQFVEAFSAALSGRRVNAFDARIINLRGDAVWYRMRFAAIYDKEGNPIRLVGTMRDVDKEKKEKTRLIAQAETDQLTGFLNKLSTGMKVNELLRDFNSENGAMFLIDIDDFKALNDTYGHAEGDNFLREFTKKLLLAFRTSDVLGRVGGEELLIYMDGCGADRAQIRERAKHIQEVCNSIRIESNPDMVTTCSIGIAIYPDDGDSYSELFEKSDEAMYHVKKNGKNNFEFCN